MIKTCLRIALITTAIWLCIGQYPVDAGLPHMTLEARPLRDVLAEINHRPYSLTGRTFRQDASVSGGDVLQGASLSALRKLVQRRYMAVGPEGDFDLGCYLPHMTNRGNLCILSNKHGFVLALEEVWTNDGGGDDYIDHIIPDRTLALSLLNIYLNVIQTHKITSGQVECVYFNSANDADLWEYTEEMELQRQKSTIPSQPK